MKPKPLDVSIIVVLGSENDFEKLGGKENVEEKLKRLKKDNPNFSASVSVISCHRNLEKLRKFCKLNKAKLWVGMAGKAAALSGIIDAFLRAFKKPAYVVGVGISSNMHASDAMDAYDAAELSVTQLPGQPVDFMGFDEEGFDNALKFYKLMADKPVKEVKSKEPQINIIHVK